MAKVLTEVKIEIEVDDQGAPQSAVADYRIEDGNAYKVARLEVASPDFTKVFHNTGAVGEFYKDVVDSIKTAEGI